MTEKQIDPDTVTDGFHISGPHAQAFFAGSQGDTPQANRTEDEAKAYLAGQDARAKRPLSERASGLPLDKGDQYRSVIKEHPAPPSVWSRVVDMVIPRRATTASDLAQQTALMRAGLRIASRRPGGLLLLVLLAGPPALVALAYWSGAELLINIVRDPFLRMAYGGVMAISAVGAAGAVWQWPRMDRGGIDLVREERAAERVGEE